MNNSKIYMAVTADKYELPVFVARHPEELAAIYGINVKSVWSYITKGNVRRGDNVKFIRVEQEEENE